MSLPRRDGVGLQPSSERHTRAVAFGILALAAGAAVLSAPARSSEPELFTQWLFTYGCGLVKRALVGDLLTRFVFSGGTPIAEMSVHVVAVVVAVASVMLYALFAARVWLARPAVSSAQRVQTLTTIGLVSMAPVGAMYYVGARQYPEVGALMVLALFANWLLMAPRHSWLLASAMLASICSILIHEASLLSTIPIMLTLTVMRAPDGQSRRLADAMGAGTFVVCAALVVYMGAVSPATAACVTNQVASRVGFAVDPPMVEVLTTTFVENIVMTVQGYTSPWNGTRIPLSLLVTAPALIFLAASLARREANRRGGRLAAVGLCPLGLIVLADDVYRWFVMAVVGLSVLLLTSVWQHDEPVEDDWVITLGLAALVIAFVLPYPFFRGASSNPLFDYAMTFMHRF